MTTTKTYTNAQKVAYYFHITTDDKLAAEGYDVYMCRCKLATRKIKKGSKSLTNLVNHIDEKHNPDVDMKNSGKDGQGTLKHFIVDPKAVNLFSWMEWVVQELREFDFVDKDLVRMLLMCLPSSFNIW